MKRLVYRLVENYGPITEFNPSYRRQWTNQVFENGKWKFVNRYIGKFGATPIVWFDLKEWAENHSPKDDEIADTIEWDGVDEEGYKNVFIPPTYEDINGERNKETT